MTAHGFTALGSRKVSGLALKDLRVWGIPAYGPVPQNHSVDMAGIWSHSVTVG